MKFISKFLGIAALMLFGASAWAEFAQGDDGFYHVATVSDLKSFRDKVNAGDNFAGKTVVIDADLDLNNEEWTPIGTGSRSGSTCSGNNFAGLFDGQNHAIVGLKISNGYSGDNGAGLFGLIKGGEVKNLSVTGDIDLSLCKCAGMLSGLMSDGGIVRGVTTYGTVFGNSGCGGIVGTITVKGKVFDSVNHANVSGATGGTNYGGIAGKAYYTVTGQTLEDCVVSNCVNYGNITAGGQSAGGIVGLSIASIRNCKNYGVISGPGNKSYGGIVGNNKGFGEIVNSVNYGKVGNKNLICVGGIVGWLQHQVDGYDALCLVRIEGNTNWGDVEGTQENDTNKTVAGILGMCSHFDNYGYSIVSNANYGVVRRWADTKWVEGYAFVGAQITRNIGSWTIMSNSTATASSSTMYAIEMTEDNVKDNASIVLAAIDTKGVQYETLAEALAAVSVDTQLAWVNGSMWDPDKQAIYKGTQYATLQDALTQAATDNADTTALIYVRPNYNGVTVSGHGPISTSMTVYGNNAKIGSGWEPTIEYPTDESDSGGHQLKKDIDFTICNLHDGAGIWGGRATDATVNAYMYNCTNAHEVFTNWNAGKGKTNYTIKNCKFDSTHFGQNCTISSQSPGTIVVEDCTFSNFSDNYVFNINNKCGGDTVVVAKNLTFNNCGTSSKPAFRLTGSAAGSTVAATVDHLAFYPAKEMGDIIIGNKTAADNNAVVSYSFANTKAVMVCGDIGTAVSTIQPIDVAETPLTGDNLPVVALVVNGDGTVTNEYKKLAAAFENVQNGESIVLVANNSEVITTAPTATSFTFDSNGFSLEGGKVKAAKGYRFTKNGNVCTYGVSNYWIDYAADEFESQDDTAKTITIATAEQLALLALQMENPELIPDAAKNCTEGGTPCYYYGGYKLKLTADIDLSGKLWTPIGWTNFGGKPDFCGEFDGDGHVISNMTVNEAAEYLGLFGYVGACPDSPVPFAVKNLTIDGASVTGTKEYCGILAGYVGGGLIKNVVVTNSTLRGVKYVGGLVGDSWGNFEQCVVAGSSENPLTITGTGKEVGGLVGIYYGDSILGCHVSNVTITGTEEVGGIAGRILYDSKKAQTVKQCTVTDASLTATLNNEEVAYEDFGTSANNYLGKIIGRDLYGSVVVPVVKIVETEEEYTSLAAAVNAVTEGQTIQLIADIKLDSCINCGAKGYVIDGAGHTITRATTLNGEPYSFFNYGSQGGGAGKAYEVRNVKLAGMTGTSYMFRVERCAMTLDNVTFDQCGGTYIVVFTYANATIRNCVFTDNTATGRIIDFNSNANNDGFNDVFVMDNCLVSGNTANGSAIVGMAEDKSATVTRCTFEGNTVNGSNNGAPLYLGDNCGTCTGSLFKDNVVNYTTTTGYDNRVRAAGAIFTWSAGTPKGIISGNAFVNNTVVKQNESFLTCYAKSVYVGGYYAADDLAGNYWDGHQPIIGQKNLTSSGNDIYAEYDAKTVVASSWATGYQPNENDYGVTVDPFVNPAAMIGNTPYDTLAAAFAAVQDGQKIIVCRDNSEVITTPPAAKNFTFDSNGKSLKDGSIVPAEGYVFQKNSDGTCFYGRPTVMIGDKAYVTLAGAVAEAKTDDVIYLVSDLAENLVVPNGKTITFDGSVFKLTGTITLGEGSKLALKGGTFTVEPKFAWLGDAYAIRDNEDGTYTVVTASVAPVQEELPVAEKVTDEKGDPIPEDKQDKAAAAIAELQTNLIEGVQAPVVTKTDTGIHEVVQANAEEIEAGLKQTAVKLGLTVDAQKQIEENMTAFLAGDESATNTADYVQVTIVKFDAVVTETVGGSMTGVPAKVTFEAMPMIAMTVSNVVGGVAEEVVVTNQLTNKMVEDMADLGHLMYFKLPIFDPKATTALVKHLSSGPEYPDETFTSEVKEKDGFRYIEVYTSHFSEFEVTTTGDVYVTCDETIGIFKLDKMDAGEVAFGVPFTKSGVEGSVAITLGELVTTGAQGSDTVKSWVAGGTDTNKYAAVVATDEVAAGKAIWYTRGGDASVPLTLAGYVKTGITTAGAAASAATDRVGMSNFVNPYGVEVNVLAKLQVTPAEGDQIVVEGSATRYFFNEGCWKKRVKGNQIVPDPKVSSDSNRLVYGAQNMEVVLTIPVPAGKTFWYVSKGTAQIVKW